MVRGLFCPTRQRLAVLLLFVALPSDGNTRAATLTWKGTIGDWSDGANWCCQIKTPPTNPPTYLPPTATDLAEINNNGEAQLAAPAAVVAIRLGAFNSPSGSGGTLVISAQFNTRGAFIAEGPMSEGTAKVLSGGNWINEGLMTIGYRGTGQLAVRGGHVVNNPDGPFFGFPSISLGDLAGSKGTLLLEGATLINTHHNTSGILVGDEGFGVLDVLSGSEVTNTGSLAIGLQSVSTEDKVNMVTIDASRWINDGSDIRVGGGAGTGVLNIKNGSMVSARGTSIGPGSQATVENATLTNAPFGLSVFGIPGQKAVLNIKGNSTVSGNIASTSNGVMNVDGGMLNVADRFTVGVNGIVNQSGTSRIVVSADASSLPAGAADGLYVGTTGGKGTLQIERGGKVFSTKARVGGLPGTVATVGIDGTASEWNVAEDLRVGVVGNGNDGRLALASGGVVKAVKEVMIGANGVLSGTGKIVAPQTRNFGTVALDQVRSNFPGTVLARENVTQYNANLLIEGDFVQVGRFGDEAGGKISLKGLSSSHRLQPGATFSTAMVVTGKAELAGELSVEFSTNYKPAIGDRYAVLAANEIAGKVDFKSAILPGVTDRFLGVNYRRNREGGDEPVLEVITLAAPKRVFDPLPNTPPFDERKNLLLVTHGTNDNAVEWVKLLAQTMSVDSHRIDAERAAQWDIVTFDWSPFNGGDSDPFDQVVSGLGIDPFTAGSNAINIGESLVRWYQAQPNGGREFETVHLMAHSAGAWLIDAFADVAAPNPDLPGFPSLAEKVHLTFFDAYTPETTQNTVVGSILQQSPSGQPFTLGPDDLANHAAFAEHYFHRNTVVLDTDEQLPHALNVDLSLLTPLGSMADLDPVAGHAFPYVWYTDTANLDFNAAHEIPGWGAATSQLYSGNFPVHANGYLKNSLWRLSVENGAELVEEAVEPVDLSDGVNMTTGNVEFSEEDEQGNTSVTFETQSPAILSSLIELQRPFEAFEFDFEFLSENPGLFSVYFDGKQVFGFENAPLGIGPGDELSSDWVWLDKEYAPGPYSITFRLDPLTDQKASLELSNLQFIDLVRVPTAPALAGDFNADGTVDAADYLVWRDTLGQMAAGLAADGDASGTVDVADYELWRAHFGRTAATSSENASPAVPEPASVALVLIASAIAALRGGRP